MFFLKQFNEAPLTSASAARRFTLLFLKKINHNERGLLRKHDVEYMSVDGLALASEGKMRSKNYSKPRISRIFADLG